jgi:glycosyltransferase involved in cell wall biosynthesis
MSVQRTFAFLTPEYPPDSGGIGDYVALLASALARLGDRVIVYTRSKPGRVAAPGVEVELLPDEFGAASRRFLAAAWQKLPEDAVVFVQYVPQGFGRKGMNLPFARFLAARRERVWLMLHEISYPFFPGQSLRLDLLALVTRLMLRVVTARAEHAFISTPAWEPIFRRYVRRSLDCEWLPIPATAVVEGPAEPVTPSERPSVAHFGTYGHLVAEPLERILVPTLVRRADVELVLVGRGSERFLEELARRYPELAPRMRATGPVAPGRIREELGRAWVTVFPFIEGVTSRRTSVMSALAAGAVIVTTQAWCTESLWRHSGAVALVEFSPPDSATQAIHQLLDDAPRRRELRARARALYDHRFHVDHVVRRLVSLYSLPHRGPSAPFR